MNSKEITELAIVGVIAFLGFQYLNNQATATADAAAAASAGGSSTTATLLNTATSFLSDYS